MLTRTAIVSQLFHDTRWKNWRVKWVWTSPITTFCFQHICVDWPKQTAWPSFTLDFFVFLEESWVKQWSSNLSISNERLYIFHLILLFVKYLLNKLRIMFCLLTSSFFCTRHTSHLPPRGMTVMRLKMADKRETSAWSDISCLSCISVRMHLITDSSSESDLITCKSFACNRESINIIQHNPLPHQGDQSSGIFVKVRSASPAAWRGDILLTWGWDQSLC